MDKINKLTLPATILIASFILGGFFYASQVNKQKSIEKQQETELQEKIKEKEQAKQEKEEAKEALNDCLDKAEELYFYQWYKVCKSRDKLTDKCLSLIEMTFDEYAKQNNIPLDKRLDAIDAFYKEKDDCYCLLPLEDADDIGDYKNKLKDECFRRYPQK